MREKNPKKIQIGTTSSTKHHFKSIFEFALLEALQFEFIVKVTFLFVIYRKSKATAYQQAKNNGQMSCTMHFYINTYYNNKIESTCYQKLNSLKRTTFSLSTATCISVPQL